MRAKARVSTGVKGVNDSSTLKECKAYVAEHKREGIPCPCCGRKVRVYPRKLDAGMAEALERLYRVSGRRWHRINRTIDVSSSLAKLRWWELVEPHPTKRGVWRVTEKGQLFYVGAIAVPSHVEIYLGEFVRISPRSRPISIRQALGKRHGAPGRGESAQYNQGHGPSVSGKVPSQMRRVQ